MKNTKKKHCSTCKSLQTIKWGIQQNKQRVKCKECGQLFWSNNKAVSDSNKEIWFKNWIIGKDTFYKISVESGCSKRTLQRYFSKILNKAPVLEFSSTDEIYLVIDGTYFPNDISLVIYRNFHLKLRQLYKMTDGEHYQEHNLVNLLMSYRSETNEIERCVFERLSVFF